MPNYTTSSKLNVLIGPMLGKGAEGTVYRSANKSDLAIKIYHPNQAALRKDKVIAMASTALSKGNFAAFPVDAIFDGTKFVGFTMPVATNRKPVHQAYSPASRKKEFPSANFNFLVRVAQNISKAVAAVHESGCIIGDINHSGVLVSTDATVTLIDTDSFQFSKNGVTFPCIVGVQDFTPPELQNKRFSSVLRTKNHDAFGLAVLIFNLLFMGRHPFAGQIVGAGDPPSLGEAIQQYKFAYSIRHHETKMAPPPHSPTLKDVPQKIADAFEIAFGPVGSSAGRPTPDDWIRMLSEAEHELTRCKSNSQHQYFSSSKNCPWCRMERAVPGFLAFNSVFSDLNSQSLVSLGDLLRRFREIPTPSLPPPLENLMPPFSPTAIVGLENATDEVRNRVVAGLILAIISSSTLSFASGGIATIAFLVLGVAALIYFYPLEAVRNISKSVGQAEKAWESEKRVWSAASSLDKFNNLRKSGEKLIIEVTNLEPQEKSKVNSLHSQRNDAQLKAFLSGFIIEHARIKGVGSSRKIVLRSYNIETAADVEYNKVRYIKGFGPNLAQVMVDWKKTIERKFVFNPNLGVSQSEIALVRSEFARKRTDLEVRLKAAIIALSSEEGELRRKQILPSAQALQNWLALSQTKYELVELKKISERRNFVYFLAAVIGPWVLVQLAFLAPILKSSMPQQSPAVKRNAGLGGTSVSPVETGSHLDHKPSVPEENPSQKVPPALPPPIEVTTVPVFEGSQPVLIDLAKPEIAFRFQKRLQELGYLNSKPDGKFGPLSRQALAAFQSASGLQAGVVDEYTERALFDLNARKLVLDEVLVPQILRGEWSQEACGAARKSEPIIFDTKKATAYDGTCTFDNISGTTGLWRASAVCSAAGKTWRSEVILQLKGRELVWTSSARGSKTYFRCVP